MGFVLTISWRASRKSFSVFKKKVKSFNPNNFSTFCIIYLSLMMQNEQNILELKLFLGSNKKPCIWTFILYNVFENYIYNSLQL